MKTVTFTESTKGEACLDTFFLRIAVIGKPKNRILGWDVIAVFSQLSNAELFLSEFLENNEVLKETFEYKIVSLDVALS